MSQTKSAPVPKTEATLKTRIANAAFALRGYNVTNLGRSPELLVHPVYGPVIERALAEASEICSETLGRKVDLALRIRNQLPTTLASFAEDAAMIVAMEIGQLRVLEEIFEVPIRQARLSLGYSVGELPALALGGVFDMEQLSPILLSLAADCAELAHDVTMGVVFTKGPGLNFEDINRLCLKITSEGKGMIAPSTHLAPNAVLVLGEGTTVARFQEALPDFFPERVMVRRNQHKWPPLHTPLVWQRNVPNRTAVALARLKGGFQSPSPPVISCVTGRANYNDFNSREILNRWVDHPQLLWDALYEMIASGVDLIIHVGPDPNLIPATFQRLETDIKGHFGSKILPRLGRRFISSMAIRPWLTPVLSSRAALLRVPFIEHIILEDWLLAQPLP